MSNTPQLTKLIAVLIAAMVITTLLTVAVLIAVHAGNPNPAPAHHIAATSYAARGGHR
jgi:hypothetical protein